MSPPLPLKRRTHPYHILQMALQFLREHPSSLQNLTTLIYEPHRCVCYYPQFNCDEIVAALEEISATRAALQRMYVACYTFYRTGRGRGWKRTRNLATGRERDLALSDWLVGR